MALFADGLPVAVPLRFATGAFLAGVYPVCMKLMASWSPPAGRALAMGALIGCLALGSALPHLIDGLGQLNWRAVLTAAAATAFCAAIVAGALVRPGPQFPAGGGTGRSRYALAMFSDRAPRMVSLAYFGHMWELYALWTWLPTFLVVSRTTTTGLPARAVPASTPSWRSASPGWRAACSAAGPRPPRPRRHAAGAGGQRRVLPALAAVLHRGPPVALAFTTVWGAAVIADSGVFSTLLSEVADRRYLGTALTTQTAIGFLLTIVTIQVIPLTAAVTGWRYAFLALAAGPMTALPALAALSRQIRPNGLPSTLTERTLSRPPPGPAARP